MKILLLGFIILLAADIPREEVLNSHLGHHFLWILRHLPPGSLFLD